MSPQDNPEERRRLELGRELIVNWAALFRAVHFHEHANDTVVSHCEKIRRTVGALIEQDDDAELTVRHDSIFVNGLRIRAAAVASTSYQRLIDLLRAAGIGTMHVDDDASPSELEVVARLLQTTADSRQEPSELVRELGARGGVSHVQLEPEEQAEELPEDLTPEQIARRVYLRSISVVKSIFHEYRTVDRISARRVKRVVQAMIDSLDGGTESLMHLTSLKNYDEYTFNHSVNVSVMGIALGRHAGLSRRQLYSVGQAGMMHDLGKLAIPKDLLNKPGRMTPEERQRMQLHSVDGFVSIASKLGASPDTIDIALTAFEHHWNEDGTGYPQVATPRPQGLLSRIITVVDRYDAMTSDRVYRAAMSPEKALAIMFGKLGPQYDQALLSYFLNLMGNYPLGTTVRLSDRSIGVVLKGSSEPEFRHFPTVKLILNPDGAAATGELLDLRATADKESPTRIVETVDPKEYGIEVMDYML